VTGLAPLASARSRHTLYLDGWQSESSWGWDPGQSVWYAQLWVDGTEPGGKDGHEAPALWLAPPSYEIQCPRRTRTARQADLSHNLRFVDTKMIKTVGDKPIAGAVSRRVPATGFQDGGRWAPTVAMLARLAVVRRG
jgi:hypothetical protein